MLLKIPSSSTRSRSLLPCCFFGLHLLFPSPIPASSAANRLSTSAASSSPSLPFLPFALPATGNGAVSGSEAALFSSSFKEWFRTCRPYTVFDNVLDVLASLSDAADDDHAALDRALSALDLRLDELFVIQVLHHSPSPCSAAAAAVARVPRGGDGLLLLRLKFFEWAGRQRGFKHTRVTYNAFFRLLCRARLMSSVLDRLEDFAETRGRSSAVDFHRRFVRFHDTLVMGYAVAGRTETALQVFGQMRFQGLDLDAFSYHVLLSSLVEESAFDLAETIFSQISARGLDNPFTSYIRMKSLCKQNRVDEAAAFLREFVEEGPENDEIKSSITGLLIDAFCKQRRPGWPRGALLIWAAVSLLAGPFAPSRVTGGDVRVGLGEPLEPQEPDPSPEEEAEEQRKRNPGRRSKARRSEDPPPLVGYVPPAEKKREQTNGVAANTGDGAEKGEVDEREWNDEDFEILKKQIAKHPVGTPKRWERIAEAFGGRHGVESVIKTAKSFQEKRPGAGDSFAQFLRQRKSIDKRADVADPELSIPDPLENGEAKVGDANGSGGGSWSSGEDVALLNALKAFPKDAPMRWEKIAAAVPGRSKAACMRRLTELKRDFRSTKASEA